MDPSRNRWTCGTGSRYGLHVTNTRKTSSPRQLGFGYTGSAYTGTHRNGKPVIAFRNSTGWTVKVKDPESQYAEPGGWVTLAAGLRTLTDCSVYVTAPGKAAAR